MSRYVVIADSNCLISLNNIDEIELLPKPFVQIFITPKVYRESGKAAPKWVEIGSRSLEDVQHSPLALNVLVNNNGVSRKCVPSVYTGHREENEIEFVGVPIGDSLPTPRPDFPKNN